MQRLVRWRIKKRKARRASLLHGWLSQAHLKSGQPSMASESGAPEVQRSSGLSEP